MNVKKTIAAGVIAVAGLVAAIPAQAGGVSVHIGIGAPAYGHYYGGYPDHRWGHGGWERTLSPQQVRRILRDKGFRQIQYLDRRGTIYQVRAVNHRGHRVALVVSARNGAILNRHRI